MSIEDASRPEAPGSRATAAPSLSRRTLIAAAAGMGVAAGVGIDAGIGTGVAKADPPTKIHRFAGLAMTLIGMNATTGRLWTKDDTNGNLSQSDDWGAHWTNLRGLPAETVATGLFKVVPFAGYIYTVLQDATRPGTYRVFRAPDVARSAPLVWDPAAVFTMPADTNANVRCCFNAGSRYLFLGTYTARGHDKADIYRSADGSTWSRVYTQPAAHHVHCVAEDPYNTGHIYAALGDHRSPVTIVKSTDHGTTWATLIDARATVNGWQSVQLSFSPNWVWAAGDRIGLQCMIFDRTNGTPYAPTTEWQWNMAVPGGVGARVVTDLATTAGSAIVTSAKATFTTHDVGRSVAAGPAIPTGAYIKSFTNPTCVTMSAFSTVSTAALAATISGDRYYQIGYWGVVDPDSEIYFGSAMDTSTAGNKHGIFLVPYIGGPLELLESDPVNGVGEFFVGGGHIWTGQRKWKPRPPDRGVA